ncbi:hypothetical protein RXV95_00870 [Novosphingobium sp. ZN18A2]|uniref:hypothetical protein n=1 Tax=Novosphingobium sp. ZN18A2 TaxID=3079861 RepID=UPI0030CF4271
MLYRLTGNSPVDVLYCKAARHPRASRAQHPTESPSMFPCFPRRRIAALALAAACIPQIPQVSAQEAASPALPGPTYADLADLAGASNLVAIATVHKVAPLKAERAPGVAPGMVRIYVEADTSALLIGTGLGESVSYLADVPLDSRGKVPKLKKQKVILFARSVPGHADQLALVAPDAQIEWTPAREAQVRSILTAMVSPDKPPKITGVREAMHVPGNLAGEGETQIFLATPGGQPVSVSVLRRPGEPPRWGVSLTEIVDQSAHPPRRDTLLWYRMACFLPHTLPARANLSEDPADRQKAAADYALVMRELGPCPRTRT